MTCCRADGGIEATHSTSSIKYISQVVESSSSNNSDVLEKSKKERQLVQEMPYELSLKNITVVAVYCFSN